MKIKIILFLSAVLLFSTHLFAMTGIQDLSTFKQIPVLDSGRLKPLDTFARALLTQFSGKDHYQKQEAALWFATLVFNPEATVDDKIFLINNPDIATALSILPQSDRRYTPSQLRSAYRLLAQLQQAASKIPEKERSLAENEIMRIFDNINLYADLSNPNNKGLSPWNAIGVDFSADKTQSLQTLWTKMAEAYRQGNDLVFNMSVQMYLSQMREGLSPEDLKKLDKFPLELMYQQGSFFTWAIVFYILAFLFFVISFTSLKPLWYYLGLGAVIAGFLPHLTGLVLRVIIMARPPVSSLYETFIFVAAIAVLLGLIIEYYNRQWLGIVTAAISGTALLFIANKYSIEGDTLKVLMAVLDSNFWLATHVTTITMGYAATCVGGLLGHIWLLQAVLKKEPQILDKTYKTILGILGLALTLTFLGTNLGGIWADQSWGRFWGWDPKENGALMIVLWIALLFHAKTAQMIDALGLAVGAVIGMMVVMWAWFGVNLLSVGLHSYGFTAGVATSLIVYAAIEIIFLLLTTFLIVKKQ